jgi:hypothetical protein
LSDLTKQARYLAVAAMLIIGLVASARMLISGESERVCPLTPDECADAERSAPDPGGDEDALVSTPPEGFAFGFNDSPSPEGVEQNKLEHLASVAGANARRFPVDWQQLEPERDVWNEGGWLYYQRVYDAILAASMRPVINFGNAPAWARDPGSAQECTDFFACRYPPARSMDEEWSELATEVARRFPQAVFEIWNEPNLAIFWRPTPNAARFAELQVLAYDAIKAVDPEAIVLAGGMAANGEYESRVAPANPGDTPMKEFLEGALSAHPSIRNHMDALSFHPYPYGVELGAGSSFAKAFEDVRETLARYGESGRHLWVTEAGIPSTGDFAVGEEEQAALLVRLVRRVATMPDVDGLFLHRLVPPANEPPGSTEQGYALFRSTAEPFQPKPAYCALVDLAQSHYPDCPSTSR